MRRTLVWSGLDAPRMEIARVEIEGASPIWTSTRRGFVVRYEGLAERVS